MANLLQLSCPKCSTPLRVPRPAATTGKVKCGKCSHTFTVRVSPPAAVGPVVAAVQAPPAVPEERHGLDSDEAGDLKPYLEIYRFAWLMTRHVYGPAISTFNGKVKTLKVGSQVNISNGKLTVRLTYTGRWRRSPNEKSSPWTRRPERLSSRPSDACP